MPSVQSVQVSIPVSAFASGYSNNGFMANSLFPVIEVPNRKFTYFSKAKLDVATVFEDLMGPSAEPATVDYATTQTAGEVKDRGLMAYVPWAVIDNAQDPLKPREAYAANIMQRLLLAHEYRVQQVLHTSGNYASANTAAATAKWTDTTNGDPIKDIQAALAAISPGDPGMTKLVLGLGLEAWQALSRHPSILGLRPGGGQTGGVAAPDEIAKYLGLDQIVVSDVVRATNARGAAAAYSRLWDVTKAVVVRVPKATPTMEDNLSMFGCAFRLNQPSQTPFIAVEWDEPKRGTGKGSLGLKITHSTIESVVQNDMGFLLTSVT